MTGSPVSLRLFGGVALERDGRSVNGRATQRRRLGVLAILAAAPTGQVSRDRLVAFLWPEAETEAARHLLAGAVYELRKALGEDAILSRGDELALNPDVVECDVARFDAALAGKDLERAVGIYAGALADGLHISQAPEFERWLEETRARYQGAYRRALTTLAVAREQEGSAAAADYWVRLVALDPADGGVVLRAVQALRGAGESSLALRQCQLHETYVRKELDTAPDPRITAVSEEILKSQREALPAPPLAVPTLPIAPPVQLPSADLGRRLAFGGVALGAALLLVALVRHGGAGAEATAPPAGSHLSEAAAAGTASATALGAWLAGEREFRIGHFLSAAEHFSRAVEADSGFALGFYRLSQARLAADLPETDVTAADRQLERLIPRLPERDRLLAAAYTGFRIGNAEYAEQRYQGLVTRYPDDFEAWMQLGEVRFHYGPLRGVALAASEPAFRRAAALDPGSWGPQWHLAALAARDGRRTDAVHALDRLLAMSPGRSERLQLLLLKAVASDNRAQEERLLRELADADELVVFQLVWRVAVFFRDLPAARRLAAILTHAGRPTYAQALGRLSLVHLRLATGDQEAARLEIQRANALAGATGGVRSARVSMLLIPGAVIDTMELLALRDTIRAHHGTGDDNQSAIDRLLLGFLHLVLGQPDSTLALARQLERSGLRDWSLLLQAEVAGRQGRYEDVLAHLQAQGSRGWYGNLVGTGHSFEGHRRFLRAEALYRLGRLEPALGWYGSVGEFALADLAYLGPALEGRREIFERLGQPDQARAEQKRWLALKAGRDLP